jgi:O-antigen/teichoic acid export membrane protein
VSFFGNALRLLVTSGINLPLGIATSIVLARWLSVADRGSYALLTAFAGFAVLAVQLGVPSAAVFRLSRRESSPARVAGVSLGMGLVASALALVAGAALREPLGARFLDDPRATAYALALAAVPFLLLGDVLRGLAQGLDRFDLDNAYALACGGGLLVALLGVLTLGEGGLEAALSASLAVNAAATVWLGARVLALTGLDPRAPPREAWRQIRFGGKSWVQYLLAKAHDSLDRFLLAWLLVDPEPVAFYAVAVGVTSRLALVPSAIVTALYPRLASSTPAEAGRFTAFVIRHALYQVALSVLGLLVVGPWLIPLLYGAPYAASVAPFLWLLPGVAAITVSRVAARYFVALDLQSVPTAVRFAAVAANVLLNLSLIPSQGIVGAALASLGSYSLEAALLTFAFLRHARVRPGEVLLPRAGDLDVYVRRVERALRS